MSQDKKVTAEVVEHVKKLAKGDIVTLFQEKNSFKDPETGAPLSLSAETLQAITDGKFDHLLKEAEKKESKKKEKKGKLLGKNEENIQETAEKIAEEPPRIKEDESSKAIEDEKAEKKPDVEADDKVAEILPKKTPDTAEKTDKPKKWNPNLDGMKKRGIIGLCVLIPLLLIANYYQEQILATLSEVAKSFAIVSAVIAATFVIPLAMDRTWKKGFRVVGLLFVAIGFYMISVGGAFFNGLLALAVGAMIFMLTF